MTAAPAPPLRDLTGRPPARLTGALILVLAVLGMIGPLTLEAMVVAGDAAATAQQVSAGALRYDLGLLAWLGIVLVDAVLSVTLYQVFRDGGRDLSALTAVLRLVYTASIAGLLVHLVVARRAVLGPGQTRSPEAALVSLELFGTGFLVALVVFGAHLVALGVLALRSRVVPVGLGLLLLAGGIGYAVDSSASLLLEGYGGVLAGVLLAPAVLGELGLALWLLARGARTTASRGSRSRS